MLVEKLIQVVKDVYTGAEIKSADKSRRITNQERDSLVKAVSKAGTNEDRRNLSILLAKLSYLDGLPDNDR